MAFIYCDGFDVYSTTGGLSRPPAVRHDNNSGADFSIDTTGGVRGGGCLDVDEEFGSGIQQPALVYNFPATTATLYIGFWYKQEEPGNYPILRFFSNGSGVKDLVSVWTTNGGGLWIDSEGQTFSGPKAEYNGRIIWVAKWQYIEVMVTPGIASDGQLKVWVNDVEVLDTGASFDMGNNDTEVLANISQIGFMGGPTSDQTNTFDDVIIYDSSGTDNFTSRLGPMMIETIYPSANGTTNDGTASAGSNYTCVDEATDFNTTDYVTLTTSGDKEQYAFGNLSETYQNVKGVAVTVVDRSVSGPRQSRCLAYHSATTGNGTTRDTEHGDGSDTFYWQQQHCFSKNPSTTADWTSSEIDAAEFGVELVS